MNKFKFLSFGEIVWDIHGDTATLGGAPLNLAVHIAMNSEDAALVSAVGDDELGHAALERARLFSVNTDFVSRLSDTETAKCTVTEDENGLPSYTLTDDAPFDRIAPPDIGEYVDVICFGTLSLRYPHNREVIKNILDTVPHGEVFCDINLREPFYIKETVEYCLSSATIIKVSGDELNVVSRYFLGGESEIKDAVTRLCGIYDRIRLFIVTLGEDGSVCYDRSDGKWYSCDAKKADVVSTVGAGDSFSAAFLVKYMRGSTVPECLDFASLVSAMVCSSEAAFSEEMISYIRSVKKTGGNEAWR